MFLCDAFFHGPPPRVNGRGDRKSFISNCERFIWRVKQEMREVVSVIHKKIYLVVDIN